MIEIQTKKKKTHKIYIANISAHRLSARLNLMLQLARTVARLGTQDMTASSDTNTVHS